MIPLRRFGLALLALASLVGGAAWGQTAPGHVKPSLVAASTAAVPGRPLQLALRQQIDPGWHTYWRNAGDAGKPTSIDWTLPAGWSAGDFTWPAPKRLPVSNVMDYGYEGEVLLPVTLKVPAGAKTGSVAQLSGVAHFLVCKDICIPQDTPVSLDLPIAARAAPDPQWAGAIQKTLDAAPKAGGLGAVFAQDAAGLRLAVSGAVAKDVKAGVYFYPYDSAAIDHAALQPAVCGDQIGLTLKAPSTPKTLAALEGVIAIGDQAFEIAAKPGEVAAFSGPPCPALDPATLASAAPAAASAAASPPSGGLLAALIGAFIGGLILNLMPCVFPILSMKAAQLSAHAHEAKTARNQALLFLAGAMVTFLALGGLLLALRAGGQQLGWGFQLQSPVVVAALGLLMLLVALNLSGLFEVGLSAQGVGAGLASKPGAAGAFFTGVLAVVVAAPCTAPFMAAALGFALTAPPIQALLTFAALGIGFSFPFVAIAFIPGLLSRLPRPGAWMDTFKKVLAFPMYAAAAWLLWVLSQQTGPLDFARFLTAAVVVAFAAWLIGSAQQRGGKLGGVIGAVVLVLALAGALVPAYAPPAAAATSGGKLDSQPWTPTAVADLTAQGRPVFVDFTAAWCVTCQVNERTALSTGAVAQAFKAANTAYLRADWTNRDPDIAKALAAQGRAGVPLYLVYSKSGGPPQVLPQILTAGAVTAALKKAAS